MSTYDQKPWLQSYDEGVPSEVDIPDISLMEYWMDILKDYMDRPAFHYFGMTMTFEELLEHSGRFAAALADMGMGKGDVVAINLPNTPQYVITVVGALRAGCAISGLAPLLMPDEMTYQLNDCGARVMVTLEQFFNDKYVGISDKTPKVEMVLVSGATDFLPSVTEYPKGKPLSGKKVLSFMEYIRGYPNKPPAVEIGKDDHCCIQYTGGTTGQPKGAILTHGNMLANIYQFRDWSDVENGKEVYLSGFPMFHMAGLCVITCSIAWATTLVLIPDPRDTDHIINEMKKYKPTLISNVPSLYLLLLAKPEFRKTDFSNLKTCMSGAAPFPVDGIRELESVMGDGKLVELWGMTETSPLITSNPALKPSKPGSVGLPLPGTMVRVVDIKNGVDQVPLGEEGELIVSGPQVMKGYLNKPEETKHALREHDGRIWMHTGDVGRMDEQGYVYIVDRAKDMIMVGGYKVFSAEVEDKFYQLPFIGMCAVIGVKNPDRPETEIVKLVVQKSEAAKDKSDEELKTEILAFARNKLAPYKVPKIIEFVESIPLTSVGKINKKAMR